MLLGEGMHVIFGMLSQEWDCEADHKYICQSFCCLRLVGGSDLFRRDAMQIVDAMCLLKPLRDIECLQASLLLKKRNLIGVLENLRLQGIAPPSHCSQIPLSHTVADLGAQT